MLADELNVLFEDVCESEFNNRKVGEEKFNNFKLFLRDNGVNHEDIHKHSFDEFMLKLYTLLPIIQFQGIDFLLNSIAQQYVSAEKFAQLKVKGEKYLTFFIGILTLVAQREAKANKVLHTE